MWIIVWCYLFSMIGVALDIQEKGNKLQLAILRRYYYFLIILLFMILTGSRINTGGTDYVAYENFFNLSMNENPWNYQILFIWLRNLIKIFHGNYNDFLFFISLISHIIIYYFLKRYSKYPLTSFFIYLSFNYFWQNFTILRSSLAIFMIWLSFKYILERKKIKFLLLYVGSCSFHIGSLPLFLLYYFLNIKLDRKKILLLLILGFIFGQFSYQLMNIFDIKILKEISLEFFKKPPIGYLILIIEKIILYIYISLNLRNDLKDKKENLFYNLIVIDVIISIAFYKIFSLTRYSQYLMIGYYILLANILVDKIKAKKINCSELLIIALVIINFIKTITSMLYNNYSSYFFI